MDDRSFREEPSSGAWSRGPFPSPNANGNYIRYTSPGGYAFNSLSMSSGSKNGGFGSNSCDSRGFSNEYRRNRAFGSGYSSGGSGSSGEYWRGGSESSGECGRGGSGSSGEYGRGGSGSSDEYWRGGSGSNGEYGRAGSESCGEYGRGCSGSRGEYWRSKSSSGGLGSDNSVSGDFGSGYKSSNSGSTKSSVSRPLSPLSPLENIISPQLFGTSMRLVDDTIFVMDGVLMAPDARSKGKKSAISEFSGLEGEPTSFSVSGVHKKTLCKIWEELGRCPYGAGCQFAHGKEELIPTSYATQSHTQVRYFRPHATSVKCKLSPVTPEPEAGTGNKLSTSSNSTCPTSTSTTATSSAATIPLSGSISSSSSSSSHTLPISTTKQNPKTKSTAITYDQWSPIDDGIEITLPSQSGKCPSREEIDAHINSILVRPARKRMPVFKEFCP